MYVGSLPIEFDVLMKYCNHLAELLWNKFDYSFFVKAEIITEKDKDFILCYERTGGFKIILIKTLNYLLSGDTNLFYKLLDNLQYIPNGDKVTLRIQTEIKLFTGTYACIYINIQYYECCILLYVCSPNFCSTNFSKIKICILFLMNQVFLRQEICEI